MSQAYLGRSARSLNQSVYSGYSTGTAASQGRIVRRTPAPRFHPFIIIVAVICIGMVIVGLVMTIIANWPGYSSIGFNALEIVGPVILGVGGLALICTIAVVVMRNRYQKEEWERKMIDAERSRAIWASRTTMEPQTPTASIGKPSKSILKKTPSTSTYGRDSNVFEEGSDSGVAYTPNHVNNSYEPESDASDTNKPHPVYKIETMPDPAAARQGRHGANHAPYREQHSTDSESHVPVPIRVPKAKKQKSHHSQPQYAQEAYATQEPPLARGSPLVGTPDIGGMSDRLSYTSDQEIVATPTTPTSYQPPQPKPHRTMQNYEAHQRSYDAFDPNSGHQQQGFQPPPGGYEQPAGPVSQGDAAPRHKSRSRSRDEAEPQPEDLDRNTEVRRSRRKKKKKPAEGSAAEAVQEGAPSVEYAKPRKHKKRTAAAQPATAMPAPAQQSSPTLTRINIHAQPGTSVSITPGGPQYQAQPAHNASKGSVETEI